MKKIRIMGTMGSGKSYLGEKLSKRFNIDNYSLDDIFWKNKYSLYEESEVIEKRIEKILKKKFWIIEGVYGYRCNLRKTFKDADEIIWINPSIMVLICRLLKRYFQRMFAKDKVSKDSLILIMGVIKHKLNMGSKSRRAYEDVSKKYKSKVIKIKNADIFLEGLK